MTEDGRIGPRAHGLIAVYEDVQPGTIGFTLRDPAAHRDQSYDLTGPAALTLHEVGRIPPLLSEGRISSSPAYNTSFVCAASIAVKAPVRAGACRDRPVNPV